MSWSMHSSFLVWMCAAPDTTLLAFHGCLSFYLRRPPLARTGLVLPGKDIWVKMWNYFDKFPWAHPRRDWDSTHCDTLVTEAVHVSVVWCRCACAGESGTFTGHSVAVRPHSELAWILLWMHATSFYLCAVCKIMAQTVFIICSVLCVHVHSLLGDINQLSYAHLSKIKGKWLSTS